MHIAKREIARLGLTGWSVAKPSDTANGTTRCMDVSIANAQTRTVTLRALGGPNPPSAPGVKLADKLRAIETKCQPLPAAVQQVKNAAAELGIPASHYQLNAVTSRPRAQ